MPRHWNKHSGESSRCVEASWQQRQAAVRVRDHSPECWIDSPKKEKEKKGVKKKKEEKKKRTLLQSRLRTNGAVCHC